MAGGFIPAPPRAVFHCLSLLSTCLTETRWQFFALFPLFVAARSSRACLRLWLAPSSTGVRGVRLRAPVLIRCLLPCLSRQAFWFPLLCSHQPFGLCAVVSVEVVGQRVCVVILAIQIVGQIADVDAQVFRRQKLEPGRAGLAFIQPGVPLLYFPAARR